MWHQIETFVEGLSGVSDEETLFTRLEAIAADLGYPYYAFGSLWGDPAAMDAHPAPAVRLNYPPDWISHYFSSGYDKIDPVVSISPYAQTSVTWDELRPFRSDFFDEAAGFGLRSGISIPLRAIQGCYVMCLATPEAKTIELAERVRLELLAHGFFSAYLRARKLVKVDHGLSENTIKVIRLSMAGLSVAEIAERLELTSDGVYWCMKDARKRLKCANQAQVHLVAIQQGIVAI
ncbi:helix-turn-helix transcriptional regulator [Azospirillum argentinense]